MNPFKKKKELGWTKRHDEAYNHDYYENDDGRVTWSDHSADTRETSSSFADDVKAANAIPNPVSAPKQRTGSEDSNGSSSFKSLRFEADVKTTHAPTLGTIQSGVSGADSFGGTLTGVSFDENTSGKDRSLTVRHAYGLERQTTLGSESGSSMDMSSNPLHNAVVNHEAGAHGRKFDTEVMPERGSAFGKMQKRMSTATQWITTRGNSFGEEPIVLESEVIEDEPVTDLLNFTEQGDGLPNPDGNDLDLDKSDPNQKDPSKKQLHHHHHHHGKHRASELSTATTATASTTASTTSKPLPPGAKVSIIIGPDGKKRRVVYLDAPRSTRKKIGVWSMKIMFAVACVFAGLYLAYYTQIADFSAIFGPTATSSGGDSGGSTGDADGGGTTDPDEDGGGGGSGRYTAAEIDEMLKVRTMQRFAPPHPPPHPLLLPSGLRVSR